MRTVLRFTVAAMLVMGQSTALSEQPALNLPNRAALEVIPEGLRSELLSKLCAFLEHQRKGELERMYEMYPPEEKAMPSGQ